MYFPVYRPRRLRRTEALRGMIRETELNARDFIYPLFVVPGTGVRKEIASMPGVYQQSHEHLVEGGRRRARARRPGGDPVRHPREEGRRRLDACRDDGIVQRAIEALKRDLPSLVVITDVCLCEYTDHGHCGIIENGDVANDPTLELLAQEALSHARAGADMVAPSDMMDGRVGAIREALDDDGFTNVPIMAYSAKYASGFYGPFREAAESTPQFGDRRSYQMDPANGSEALRESRSTSRRAPTSSWSSRRSPTSTSSRRSTPSSTCRWPPTTSAASTRWSRPRPRGLDRRRSRDAGDPDLDQARRRRHDPDLPREGGRGAAQGIARALSAAC